MHKKLFSGFSTILAAAFALSFAAFADLSAVEKAHDATESIKAYELQINGADSVQEWVDGSLTENAGQSSEWFAIILARSESCDFSRYADALGSYIRENNVASSTSRMKNALALTAAGGDTALANDITESSVGEQGIMSLIYGLHLLNLGYTCSRYTVGTLTDELLSMQFGDGGWAIMGENGDIDVTAMTVQALSPQYDENENVRSSVERALDFLSAKQQDDGGYSSFGTPNPESASQVLIAVSALGLDVTDTRFVKDGKTLIDGILKYRLDDGSFTHSEGGDSNKTATVQAYLSLTAYLLMQEKGERLYDFPKAAAEQAAAAESPAEEAAETAAVTTAPDAAPAETAAVTEENVSPAPQSGSYKPVAYAVIGGCAVIGCVVLFALKKRRMSNFVAVIIVAGAAAAFVFFTDFRTAEEYYTADTAKKENVIGTVTMTIRCDTIVGKDSNPYVPADGVILDTTEFQLSEGETAYDILAEAARRYNIQMQNNGGYIAGIGYLYEYDYGDLSGWIYHINGDAPFVMCSEYKLADGDKIEWLYTCELGNDL